MRIGSLGDRCCLLLLGAEFVPSLLATRLNELASELISAV